MMVGRWLAVTFIITFVTAVASKKVHLDLKDLAELKVSDLMELVLPTVNAVKEAVTLDNAKAALKTVGSMIGEGAQSAVKAYNDAGGITGIAKNLAGKASDAFQAVKDLVKPGGPLLTNPNYAADKLGQPNIVEPIEQSKIPLKELAERINNQTT